ncbi:UNVERIFIED_CONTAM: hypothetical protein GTU68_051789 [Idotea baltica]|nr:hypothetical protein [Idotea baltica]
MWFRNLLIYRLTQETTWTAEALEDALRNKPAKACSSQETSSYGFISPIKNTTDAVLLHSSQNFHLITAQKEEKLLPSTVINDAVQEKTNQIEREQMRKVYKKERNQIKDEIIQTLLPRAFIRRTKTTAALLLEQGLIVIDTANTNRAEELLSALREVLGSLPIRPLRLKSEATHALTHWLKAQRSPQNFVILDECELCDQKEEGGVIRCKRQDLNSEEIQLHINSGKQVTQLALEWRDKLSFIVNNKLVVKRLAFKDILREQVANDINEDPLAQFDATFILMMLTLTEFLPDLFEALGGEDKS